MSAASAASRKGRRGSRKWVPRLDLCMVSTAPTEAAMEDFVREATPALLDLAMLECRIRVAERWADYRQAWNCREVMPSDEEIAARFDRSVDARVTRGPDTLKIAFWALVVAALPDVVPPVTVPARLLEMAKTAEYRFRDEREARRIAAAGWSIHYEKALRPALCAAGAKEA